MLEDATIAIRRVKAGRHAKSQMLLGLRGVGKTVLLNQVAEIAEGEDYLTAVLEAAENRRLAEMLVPPLRAFLYKLSRVERARERANRALGILRAFASAFQVTAGGVGLSVRSAEGVADSGHLESDLPELFLTVAETARAADRPVLVAIDEVQYLEPEDLAALIVSVRKIGQRNLPVIVFGAGLPQLAALAGEAKSYAERLFDYPPIVPWSTRPQHGRFGNRCTLRARRSKSVRFTSWSGEPRGTPTSSRNGAHKHGTLPRNPPSPWPMSRRRR